MKKLLTTCFLAVVFHSASIGQSLGDARLVAQNFAQRLGAEQPVRLISEDERSCEFENESGLIKVSKFGNYVALWVPLTVKRPWQDDPEAKPFVEDTSKARTIAEAWAHKMSLNNDVLEKVQPRKVMLEDGKEIVDSYSVVYRDRPYPDILGMNSRTYVVNAFTGELESYHAFQGVTYDEPVVAKTKEEAIEIAGRRVAEVYPGAEVVGAQIKMLAFTSDGGPEEFRVGEPLLWPKRRARLAYYVVGSFPEQDGSRSHNFSVEVDAETGRILGGGISKGSSRQEAPKGAAPSKPLPDSAAIQKPSTPPADGKFPLLEVVLGAIATLLGAVALWRFRTNGSAS